MLLSIDVKPEDVVFNKGGRIIIKVRYYSQFATAASLITVKGETKKDFDKNKGIANKTLFVGQKGGLSLA
jgi:hypothetical protein